MKCVLIADDSRVTRRLLGSYLASMDLRVLEARDGIEALEIAFRQKPDAIVLDWMMPGHTGPEVTIQLRASLELANVPILLLTAMSEETDQETARIAGVTQVLHKPLHGETIRRALRGLLNL